MVHKKIRKISSEKFKETSWTWFNIWKNNKQIKTKPPKKVVLLVKVFEKEEMTKAALKPP